jgi:predicted AAA+ superfamily ATPase
MNDHQLGRLLNEQSPWRARAQWEADDPDLRAAARLQLDYEPEPLADIHPPGLYVFRGPRRVGKSLELKRAVARLLRQGVDAKTVFYCSCDGLSKQDLRRLIVQGHNVSRTLPGPRYWFLDEVTAVRGWSDIVKSLRDQHTGFRESCVVLTGSSARDLEQARKDLADRRGGIADSDRLLLPMGFRSFCGALGLSGLPDPVIRPKDFMEPQGEQAILELEPWTVELDDHWRLFLEVGGFPRAVGEYVGAGAVSEGFIQGLWDVVAGEAIRATTMSDTEVMALLDRLVENLASPINATRVSENVGLSGHQAVLDRITDLVSAFLAWRCHRIRQGRPNTAAQRKLYFVDPLIAQLPHHRNATYPMPDSSKLNEQQIGLALARAVSFEDPAAFVQSDRIMYERTETDAEIDFVGPELDVPFECKYSDGKWRREAQTMKARYGRGIIAMRLPLVVGDDETVWAVPAGVVCWLLGE